MDHNARGVRPRSVIELVDLRYRPEVNTIGALAESDSSEHAPLAEPIWTTTTEESGLRCGGKSKEVIMLCCQVSRESDLRAEQQHHVSHHGKNGSQAQHIGACEQSKGEARCYIWIRPVGMVFLRQVLLWVLPRADLA